MTLPSVRTTSNTRAIIMYDEMLTGIINTVGNLRSKKPFNGNMWS